MKTKNLLFLLLFIFPFTVNSQEIIAPSTVCQGECHEIFYEGSTTGNDLVWTVNYNGVLQTYLDSSLCFFYSHLFS